MQRWFYMLGGMLVWAVHFVGVYAIASIGDVVARADDPTWRMIGLGFSVLCALAGVTLFFQAVRRGRAAADDEVATLASLLATAGAGIATIAIVFQTLPTVVGY